MAASIEGFLKAIPARRAGSPEEVAELVLFLLSAKSGYCVGTLMYCDGGLDAHLRGPDWPKAPPRFTRAPTPAHARAPDPASAR
ncbi:SDR family oxidoreductase [Streptomyces sp. NPDC102360]|uniref:SDR family oxidoreductase n=1 Tax=Streptomyces sp. NPDC102360 TaxID=3366160 RepID=UPI003818B1D5